MANHSKGQVSMAVSMATGPAQVESSLRSTQKFKQRKVLPKDWDLKIMEKNNKQTNKQAS